jgi:hypothetical protein
MAQRAGDGVLFVNAINLLKARPDGVSGEEISTVLQHSEPLLNSLKGNEFVSHDTISNIFYYKNHLTFRSEEALLATLSREPLAITPTFEEPFRAAQPLVKVWAVFLWTWPPNFFSFMRNPEKLSLESPLCTIFNFYLLLKYASLQNMESFPHGIGHFRASLEKCCEAFFFHYFSRYILVHALMWYIYYSDFKTRVKFWL